MQRHLQIHMHTQYEYAFANAYAEYYNMRMPYSCHTRVLCACNMRNNLQAKQLKDLGKNCIKEAMRIFLLDSHSGLLNFIKEDL